MGTQQERERRKMGLCLNALRRAYGLNYDDLALLSGRDLYTVTNVVNGNPLCADKNFLDVAACFSLRSKEAILSFDEDKIAEIYNERCQYRRDFIAAVNSTLQSGAMSVAQFAKQMKCDLG